MSSSSSLRRSTRLAKKEEEKPTLTTESQADSLTELFGKMTIEKEKPKTRSRTKTQTSVGTEPEKKPKQKAPAKPKVVFSEEIEKIRNEIKTSSCEEVYELLFPSKVVQYNPIAVIVAGPAGAGKTTVYKSILPKWFLKEAQYANVDNYVEYFQEKYNLFTNPSEYRAKHTYEPAEMRSLNMSALIKGAQCTERDLQAWMLEGRHLIIDKPCDEARIARSLVNKLKDSGYDVYMIVVHVSLNTALRRNNPYYMINPRAPSSSQSQPQKSHQGRERQLPDAVIQKIWEGVHKNITEGVFESIFESEPDKLLMIDNETPTTLLRPSKQIMEAKSKWDVVFPKTNKYARLSSQSLSSQEGGISKHKGRISKRLTHRKKKN